MSKRAARRKPVSNKSEQSGPKRRTLPAALVAHQFKPGQSGNPAGRPQGAVSKLNRLAKEAFQEVFEMLGGVEGLYDWATTNKTEFYRHYARMIPLQVVGDGTAPPAPVGMLQFKLVAPSGQEIQVGQTPKSNGAGVTINGEAHEVREEKH